MLKGPTKIFLIGKGNRNENRRGRKGEELTRNHRKRCRGALKNPHFLFARAL